MSVAAVCAGDATTKLDSIFTPLVNRKSPGLAFLVQKDGRTLFRKSYGVRDLRTLTRIDAKTDRVGHPALAVRTLRDHSVSTSRRIGQPPK